MQTYILQPHQTKQNQQKIKAHGSTITWVSIKKHKFLYDSIEKSILVYPISIVFIQHSESRQQGHTIILSTLMLKAC